MPVSSTVVLTLILNVRNLYTAVHAPSVRSTLVRISLRRRSRSYGRDSQGASLSEGRTVSGVDSMESNSERVDASGVNEDGEGME